MWRYGKGCEKERSPPVVADEEKDSSGQNQDIVFILDLVDGRCQFIPWECNVWSSRFIRVRPCTPNICNPKKHNSGRSFYRSERSSHCCYIQREYTVIHGGVHFINKNFILLNPLGKRASLRDICKLAKTHNSFVKQKLGRSGDI